MTGANGIGKGTNGTLMCFKCVISKAKKKNNNANMINCEHLLNGQVGYMGVSQTLVFIYVFLTVQ